MAGIDAASNDYHRSIMYLLKRNESIAKIETPNLYKLIFVVLNNDALQAIILKKLNLKDIMATRFALLPILTEVSNKRLGKMLNMEEMKPDSG